ncbi:MAG: hypothetical protein JRN52_06855 [Nitrososphaerota archaeon]|nr:hypothetical protein [Nitrososphaerota archaeon]
MNYVIVLILSLSTGKRIESRSRRSIMILVIVFMILIDFLLSFLIGDVIGALTGYFAIGYTVSFLLIGFSLYYFLHYLFPEPMTNFDFRLLNNLAKKGLIEIEQSVFEREQETKKQSQQRLNR